MLLWWKLVLISFEYILVLMRCEGVVICEWVCWLLR